MRDKLVHDYFDVELDLAWKVVKKDMLVLKEVECKLVFCVLSALSAGILVAINKNFVLN